MYRKILVPLDGSDLAEQVLPYAAAFAKGFGATIELLNVIDLTGLSLASPAIWEYLDVEAFRSEARSYLDKVAERYRSEGIEVSCSVAEGGSGSVILDEAKEDPERLIAISTHGRSGVTRWVLGSTTEKLLNAITNPMLVVRSKEQAAVPAEVRLEKLILPLDGSPLAELILPHAAAVAKALLLEVILVRTIPSVGDYHRYMQEHFEVGPGPTVSRVFSGPYEEFASTASADAMQYLHWIAERLQAEGVLVVEPRLLEGQPAEAIVDLAHEESNNLVAMTTHGRSGVGRWVLGSITDRVVRLSDDPVLVIRAS